MHAAVARECCATRTSCGMFDASTLGKIEVVGKDAVTFMNRLYVNAWTNLAVGRCRYGMLLRDDGFIYDDGVVARIGEDRFHVTTTTGGAPRVLALMEDYLQTEWPELKVWLTSTTEQWAVIAVQGPSAREVLAGLVDVDISASAFPHMSVARGHVCGVPMRLFRVSFTGELGFEVNVPADFGARCGKRCTPAASACGMHPYGTETMHVLRAEKGYIIVGQDTDGTVTPDDAGLAWAIGKNKPDFVGKRSLERPAMSSAAAPSARRPAHRRPADGARGRLAGHGRGRQPCAHPPARTRHLLLLQRHSRALHRPGACSPAAAPALGQTLYVPTNAGEIAVKVASPVFYDPKGARLNA